MPIVQVWQDDQEVIHERNIAIMSYFLKCSLAKERFQAAEEDRRKVCNFGFRGQDCSVDDLLERLVLYFPGNSLGNGILQSG